MFVKTLNIIDSVSNIETSTTYKYYWVRNLGTEDVFVFKAPSDADTNKKIILSQDEYVKIIPENNNIYFKSSSTGTKIEVYGTNTDICPFKIGNVKERGGDGGGTLGLEEVTLWENDGTTNPETVTLSEPITNFDEFIIEATYTTTDGGRYRYTNTWLVSADLIGMKLQLNDEEHYVACVLTTSTTLTNFGTTSRPVVFTKIIGRRYTKVSPTGYREIELYSANEPHKTNVELSQPYTNFDEIVIIWKYSDMSSLSDYPTRYETTKLTSQMNTDDIIAIWEGNVLTNAYVIYDSTHLNFVMSDGTYYSYLAKVIGIKYGSGGGDIDDYTTTERKIGKWIDGSDLYQRTFEVTGLHNDGTYDDNILGTSNIVIRDWTGYLQYDTGASKQYFTVQGYGSGAGDWIGCWTTTGCNDLSIRAKLNTGVYALDKAVITIKYTKSSE